MAVDTSLPTLLDTLTQSLAAANDCAPKATSIKRVSEGISLLDVKNELLLSYLQNLVFLILLKLRNQNGSSDQDESEVLDDAVVKKMVELRIYVEKGVRPLEGRIKYQMDKVLRAAEDAAILPAQSSNKKSTKTRSDARDEFDDEDSEEASEEEDDAEGSRAALTGADVDDLQYRPNPSSLIRMSANRAETETNKLHDGIYRPPRIAATVMPTTGHREKEERRSAKSATLDEFVSTELSTAPLSEPSIGSNIVSGGRRSKSEREKQDEQERRDYEERNYTRLPKESKKERAKKNKGQRDAGYGGEEWRGLGEGIDRIERLTKRNPGEARNVLEKSRKRATEDGPRGSGGAEIGQGYQKRLKTLEGKRRDRGKR